MTQECIDLDVLWKKYASTRPYVAPTPHLEAASIITRNRGAISQDVWKQSEKPAWKERGLPHSPDTADVAVRELVTLLINGGDLDGVAMSVEYLGTLATFLDERMCVPRDMGAMSAVTIKDLAVTLREAK